MDNLAKIFWENTYRQNIGKMIGICYRYTQNIQAAEDLAHHAFLVAIDKISSFQNRGPFEAWLRRVVVNTALQWLRDQKKQQNLVKSIVYNTAPYDVQQIELDTEQATFSKAELLEAINFLPEHHRLVFNLYVIDNFTHAQIGTQLGISEGTSKSHLARARKKIRELLANRLKNNIERKRVFIPFFLPVNLWNGDSYLFKKLGDLPIQPRSIHFLDSVNFNGTGVPGNQAAGYFSKQIWNKGVFIKAVAVILVAVSLLYFYPDSKNKDNAKVTSHLSPESVVETKNSRASNMASFDSPPATISDNFIISNETKKSEKMKNLIPVTTLLVSSLAFDTTVLFSKLPVNFESPLPAVQNISAQPKSSESSVPGNQLASVELFGTIYASKLFWSAIKNAIHISGKDVKVDLNTQHFSGSGRFSFINNVNYLVVDGKPMKINETINLTDKKYSFTQLSAEDAMRKYGDKGKLGAVEVLLAE